MIFLDDIINAVSREMEKDREIDYDLVYDVVVATVNHLMDFIGEELV